MDSSKLKSLVLPTVFTLCFIWAFFAGFLVHKYAAVTSSPTTNIPFAPNKISFQEEYDLVFITNEESNRFLMLDFVKDGQEFFGKARYFDGQKWIAKDLVENNIIISEQLVELNSPNGLNNVDNTQITVNLSIGDNTFRLSDLSLPTPMAIKTRKTFTKFAGAKQTTDAKLKINNQPVDAKIALLKGYNLEKDSSSELELGVNTYWFVFWDAHGNFYHLDKSIVANPTKTYQSHDFFAILYQESNPHSDYYNDSLTVNLGADNNLKVSYKDATSTYTQNYLLSDFFDRTGFDVRSRGAILSDNKGGIGLYMDLGK